MSLLSSHDVRSIMEKKLKSSDFEVLDFKLAKPPGDSFGFLSINDVLKVTVKQQTKVSEHKFFVKHYMHESDYHKGIVDRIRAAFKEAYMYNVMLPKLDQYAHTKYHPECYFASEDIVVLEDMAELGYVAEDVSELFDLERCEITLELLAEMHAASITYEIKEKVKISEEHADIDFPTFFIDKEGHPGFKFIRATEKAMKEVLKEHFSHLPKDVTQEALALIRRVPQNVQSSKTELNVLSHGDMWCNNVMLKRRADSKGYTGCLVDFQSVRYGPPALDVLQFIFVSTASELWNRKVRGIDYLLRYYHKHLAKCLAQNNVDVNSVLTWEQFKKSSDNLMSTISALSVLYNHFVNVSKHILQPILTDPSQHEKYFEEDRTEVVMKLMKSDKAYRDRLTDSINYLCRCAKECIAC